MKNRHEDYLILYESVKDLYSLLNIEILPHPKTKIMDSLIKKYKLPPRDLVHIATAIENNCNHFLTLDSDFKQISEEIEVIEDDHD
ncbi:PIN domain-containing protein [Methermicoccus shengliensis]|uniref:PIN domain-containing protein n=1 Tax=Methermicoccus shengliensis TaxID=660064 RepID=UPI000A046C3C